MKMLEKNVTELHRLIEAGETVLAIEKFYAESVSIQENDGPPRIGKTFNLQHEKENLKGVKEVKSSLINVAINEATGVVMSEWKCNFIDHLDQEFLLEEVSVQQWKNDKIIFERFYYNAIKNL